MPEWPEVKVVVHQLQRLVGSVTSRSWSNSKYNPGRKLGGIEGLKVKRIRQRAKFIEFHLRQGSTRKVVIFHLGMSGKLGIVPLSSPALQGVHCHAWMAFEHKEALVFVDPRKFGRAMVIEDPSVYRFELYKNIGPEAAAIDFNTFHSRVSQKPKWTVKKALLDQSLVSGYGNIYANEILHYAQVHPHSRIELVPRERWLAIHGATPRLFDHAFRCGGSSPQSFRGPNGESGTFQNHHRIYGREGKPCNRCGRPIMKGYLDGRSTFWCQCSTIFDY